MALRILVAVTLVLASGFTLRMAWEEMAYPTTPAQAQTRDLYDCASFGSQKAAQAELQRNPSDPSNLDPNGNGIACENYPYGRGTSGSASATSDPSTTATASPPATASPTASPTATASASSSPLMNSGGPKHGPVPLMPDGRCPKEYPVERDGGCYR